MGIYVLENKRDNQLYFGLSKEEVKIKVTELKLENNEWFAHLAI